ARSVLGSARVRRGIVKSTKPETAMSAGLLTLPPCASKNAVVSAEAKEGRHAGADQKDCRCGYAARRARHERRIAWHRRLPPNIRSAGKRHTETSTRWAIFSAAGRIPTPSTAAAIRP